jgi:hypothetical protein
LGCDALVARGEECEFEEISFDSTDCVGEIGDFVFDYLEDGVR